MLSLWRSTSAGTGVKGFGKAVVALGGGGGGDGGLPLSSTTIGCGSPDVFVEPVLVEVVPIRRLQATVSCCFQALAGDHHLEELRLMVAVES